MPIKDIIEVENKSFPRHKKPIKAWMDINIPLVIAENIPKRNGSIYKLCESGENCNTSSLLNMFKRKNLHRKKFTIYFIFVLLFHFYQLLNYPFKHHKYVYNKLTYCVLEYIHNELVTLI